MKISLITISYNSESSIRDTIESVLMQDYDDIEYIVVDGNSKDRTMEIVGSYGNRISKTVSEPDKGLYDALNKGIGMASGDVVGFIHSDDILAGPGIISLIARTFEEQNTDSVYGDLIYVYKNDTSRVLRYWKAGKFSRSRIKNGWMPPHPSFYVKREVYEKYGGFDISFRIAADYDSILRFLGKQKITTAYIPEVLVKMRVGGESNKSLKNIIRKSKEDIRAMRKNGFSPFPAIIIKNVSKIHQFVLRKKG